MNIEGLAISLFSKFMDGDNEWIWHLSVWLIFQDTVTVVILKMTINILSWTLFYLSLLKKGHLDNHQNSNAAMYELDWFHKVAVLASLHFKN